MKPTMKTPLGLLLALAACFGPALAEPALPQVVAGQATFTQQGNVFSITNAPNTIINWHSFSVGQGEVTRFIQQSSDSAILNRVVGQDPSRILGALQSNGQVFLINPNGVLFGKDARIDVAGLTASSLDIANADFLAGRRSFQAGARAGAVANQGSIATPSGGRVYLIGPEVENSGVIRTPEGQVVLAAGRSVQLVDSGNPDLQVVVSAPQDAAINLGQVVAAGGGIGIYGALVRHKGIINADSAQVGANGKIVLKASRDTTLEAGSVTSALGAGSGGAIHLLGQRVGITGNAQVDASGHQGGGTVLVGGDYQGKNPLLPNAQQTLLGKDASVRADALEAGNGGKVVLWSDGATRAFGRISARGGLQGGDGGLVETSGAYLTMAGLRVDTKAGKGATGTWLLDPYNIEISSEPSDHGLADADQFSEGGDESTTYIEADELSLLSTSANVVLQARNNVVFNGAFTRAANTTGSLTVEAGNGITVNSAIETQGGALKLKANHAPYASGYGAVVIRNTVDTGGGAFAASGYDISLEGTGKVLGAGAIDLRAASGLLMYSGAELKSGGYIDIMANRMDLAGAIGPAASQLPMVSLRPATLGRQISIRNFDISDGTHLHLSPLELSTISAHSINIGSTASEGPIHVASPLSLTPTVATNLVLETQGPMWVDAPISMHSGSGSTLLLNVSGKLGGAITLDSTGSLAADNVLLRADNMSLGGTVSNAGLATGTIGVAPANAGTGIIVGGSLTASSPYHLMLNASELGNLSGGHITIGGIDGQYGEVSVSGFSLNSGLSGSPSLAILAGEGNLTLAGNLITDRKLALQGNRIESTGGFYAKAPSIELSSYESIGTSASPLNTVTGYLSATNHYPGGAAPINIQNNIGVPGVLSLASVSQSGTGNNGVIAILNEGGMTLLAGHTVSTGGAVALRTRSPLTIAGSISTISGAINLEAGNGGVLTVEQGATVISGGGMSVSGGAIVNNGTLSTSSGTITTVGPVSGSGTMVSPDTTPSGPTLAECLLNPGMSGCANVLPSMDACVASPSAAGCVVVLPSIDLCAVTPTVKGCSARLPSAATCAAAPATLGCAAVLPTVQSCTVTPSAPGCATVLPTLAACIAAPATPGCSVVLPAPAVCQAAPNTPGCAPTIDVCVAKPATAGCGAVLPTLDQCVATPAANGCSVVLPSMSQCTAAPTTAGCQAVLPTIGQCTATPSAAGCQAVLPTIGQCTATPSAAGCQAVLPTITQCTATPSAAGCQAVLPTLGQCVVNPAQQGCAAVLPTLSACSATPGLEGCSAVLPPIGQCSVNPSVPGCQAVLPTLNQCVANPSLAGCSAVLPSLQMCTGSPAAPGCSAVLPTLSACVAAPGTAGCAVVLPTIAQCVGSPTLQGCSVVLPPLDACVANPAAPGCVVVAPPKESPAGSPVAQVTATTINLINQTSGNVVRNAAAAAVAPVQQRATDSGETRTVEKTEAAKEGGNTPIADSINQGGKSAKLVKTYCN